MSPSLTQTQSQLLQSKMTVMNESEFDTNT